MVCGIVCSRAVLYIVGIAALSVHITHIFSRREGRARHRHVQMYTCTHVHMYTFTFNAPDTLQADEAQQQLKRAEDALQLKRREEVRGVQCLCVCVGPGTVEEGWGEIAEVLKTVLVPVLGP